MEVSEAVSLLNDLINEVDAVLQNNNLFDAWRRRCRTVLSCIFGDNSSQSKDHMKVNYKFSGSCNIGDDRPFIQAFNNGLEKARELLRAYIWEIEKLGMPNSHSVRDNEPADDVIESTPADGRKDCAMDVLISWSKNQSREMASVFHDWLPKVVPGLKPWMSSKDIDKGKQWFDELQSFLGEATSCIICVTSENVRSPWIYYETGAIAAKKQDLLICSYLVGINASMLTGGPLAQYQCTETTKEEMFALIRSLNTALPKSHDEELLRGNFESKWPEFEQELARILALEPTSPADFVQTEADELAGYNLSSEARTLLVAAADDGGYVYHCRSSFGSDIRVGEQTFNEPHNQRSEVIWEQAVKDLAEFDLLIDRKGKGQVFQITAKGYEVADTLQKRGDA